MKILKSFSKKLCKAVLFDINGTQIVPNQSKEKILSQKQKRDVLCTLNINGERNEIFFSGLNVDLRFFMLFFNKDEMNMSGTS